MTPASMLDMVEPDHPGIVMLRRGLSCSEPTADDVLRLVSGLHGRPGGPTTVDDVLTSGEGSCLGLSAVTASILAGHHAVGPECAYVVVLDRGIGRYHAAAAYRCKASGWSIVDATNTLSSGACPPGSDAFAPGDGLWRLFGAPGGTTTLLGFGYRSLRTCTWRRNLGNEQSEKSA